ncbi:MAG: ATP-grasp domain-containing protein [Pseudomonadota bacterium]
MVNTLIIAALSSRSYVKVAVDAGFEVIAIDAFADVDTQKLAKKVLQIDANCGQFNAQQLLDALTEIDLTSCLGFCYGAGFEAQPELLSQIALMLPMIGNSAETLQQCKQPESFFALCNAFNMPYPKTLLEKPINTLGWLQKTVGASGGEHIKTVFPLNLGLTAAVYYQQKQVGTPISCLFLADGKNALVVGFNEQWCSPTALSPYRFGGLVSHAVLSEVVQDKLTEFVQLISQKIGLKGLNSCDCLVQDDAVFMLEINPRLSASVGLYKAKRGNLFAAHVAAFLGQLDSWPVVDKKSQAIHIIYANQIAKAPSEMDWPEWVCDVPQPNSVIPAGAPICSVLATARTAKLAKQKVLQRAASL